MGELIKRLRLLIGDAAGSEQVFEDIELQDALDVRRETFRYLELVDEPTINPGGGLTDASYIDYYAQRERVALGNWEDDVKLYDNTYTVLTPTSADLITGHWQFASGQRPPVYLIGKSYDLYRAAVELLDAWIAKEKGRYDFSADGQSFKESQKVDHLQALAARYRAKCRARTGALISTDFYA